MKRQGMLGPGATVGILGGGQLGRMLALAAFRLGCKVVGYSCESDCPLSQVCPQMITAAWDDEGALEAFAEKARVVTIEFENIPYATLEFLSRRVPVCPGAHVLSVAQHRLKEKRFFCDHNFPTTTYRAAASRQEAIEAAAAIGFPLVLKTASFGYDGKGQRLVESEDELVSAYAGSGSGQVIVEQLVSFDRELSVIGARGAGGEFASFGPIENTHVNGILDLSVAPARGVYPSVARRACELARQLMEALDATGLVCVEFFLTGQGELLINEIAPRPHNSGHYSIEAASVSQFEAAIRAITDLPLPYPEQILPAATANILGDLWFNGEPDWAAALAVPGVHLHLYGKSRPMKGRKMGHLTALAENVETAIERVLAARQALSSRTA